ncbi:MAG: LysR family transcriptional regulator [Deltaproteobacteria bacterium]|nr:LysR family transcriptional regulator [Deltaproteobacteria bacterium]
MLEGVTIEQLRTLRAVAREGSFSAAARKLGRVQAAVSQSIDRLEAQLGLRLFDRTGRAPRLTSRGEAVVALATRVHDDVEALDALVESLKRGTETRLSIALDTMYPAAALVTFARELAREHPSVELALSIETLSAVTALVRDRRATLGIAGEDADLTGLETRRVSEVRLVPVAAASHALAKHEGPIDRGALSRATQIVLSERAANAGEVASKDHGVLSPHTWRVADLATKHALIAGGLGWGHMPEHVVRSELSRKQLVALRIGTWGEWPPRRALVLVRREGAVLGPVGRWAERRLATLCRSAVHHAA